MRWARCRPHDLTPRFLAIAQFHREAAGGFNARIRQQANNNHLGKTLPIPKMRESRNRLLGLTARHRIPAPKESKLLPQLDFVFGPTYDMPNVDDGGRCQRRGAFYVRRRWCPPDARPIVDDGVQIPEPESRCNRARTEPGSDVLPVRDQIRAMLRGSRSCPANRIWLSSLRVAVGKPEGRVAA